METAQQEDGAPTLQEDQDLDFASCPRGDDEQEDVNPPYGLMPESPNQVLGVGGSETADTVERTDEPERLASLRFQAEEREHFQGRQQQAVSPNSRVDSRSATEDMAGQLQQLISVVGVLASRLERVEANSGSDTSSGSQWRPRPDTVNLGYVDQGALDRWYAQAVREWNGPAGDIGGCPQMSAPGPPASAGQEFPNPWYSGPAGWFRQFGSWMGPWSVGRPGHGGAVDPQVPPFPGSLQGASQVQGPGQVSALLQGASQVQGPGQVPALLQGASQVQGPGQAQALLQGASQVQVQALPQGAPQVQGPGQVQALLQGAPQVQGPGQAQALLQGAPQVQDSGQVQALMQGAPQVQDSGQVQALLQGASQVQGPGEAQALLQDAPLTQDPGQVSVLPQGASQVQGIPQVQGTGNVPVFMQGASQVQGAGQTPGLIQGASHAQVSGSDPTFLPDAGLPVGLSGTLHQKPTERLGAAQGHGLGQVLPGAHQDAQVVGLQPQMGSPRQVEASVRARLQGRGSQLTINPGGAPADRVHGRPSDHVSQVLCPGAKVQVMIDGRARDATVNSHRWFGIRP